MVLSQNKCAVGRFATRRAAEYALRELNSAGFLTEQIAVLAQEIDCQEPWDKSMISDGVWLQSLDSDAKFATVTGSMIGAIGGCLIGLGLLSVPGIGLIVAVGTSGTTLATTLAGTLIGAASGTLIEALTGVEITKPAQDECDRDSKSECLVIVNGTAEEVRYAEYILSRSHSNKVEVF